MERAPTGDAAAGAHRYLPRRELRRRLDPARPRRDRRRRERRGDRARRRRAGLAHAAAGGRRPGGGDVLALVQAGARGLALPGAVRVPAGAREPAGAGGAAGQPRPISSRRCASCCRITTDCGRPGCCAPGCSSTTTSADAARCRGPRTVDLRSGAAGRTPARRRSGDGLRLLRLLGGRRAVGGAPGGGRSRSGRAGADPHPLHRGASRRRAVARDASPAPTARVEAVRRPRPGQRRRPVGRRRAARDGGERAGRSPRPPGQGQPRGAAPALRWAAVLHPAGERTAAWCSPSPTRAPSP